MTTLIHTPCSRIHKIMDRGTTALGWTGFVYLLAPDSIAYASAQTLTLDMNAVSLFSATLVCSSFGLTAWSLYNKWLYQRGLTAEATADHPLVDDQVVASHFLIAPEDLESVHESRRTVIYHTEDGTIVRMETDDYGRAKGVGQLRLIA